MGFEVADTLNAFVHDHARSPAVLLLVMLLATVDGVLPPVPSETVIVALAAIGASAAGPSLLLLGCAAAVGAFAGDNVAYEIGRRLGTDRLARVRGRRLQSATRWAADALRRRGTLVVLVARYVPVGRVGVNFAAGATAFSRRRFTGLVALGAVSWAAYSVALGALAARWLGSDPLLAAAAGVALAVAIGLLLDRLVRRHGRRP